MSLASLINAPLGILGLRLSRAPKVVPTKPVQRIDLTRRDELLGVVKNDPTNAQSHLDFAAELLNIGHLYIANAEVRVARFLGAPENATNSLAERINAAMPAKEKLDHNRFYRLHSLAQAIQAQGHGLSVLDVGGGNGELAAFIPDNPYCLAEPKANGISGQSLPFPDQSFDLVVSCHVLEHIPENDRDRFLDVLMSKSRKAVILLNPFHGDGVNERLEFIWDEWKVMWAKEHLDCVMPRPEDLLDYAERRGLQCTMTPNANIAASFSLVWIDRMMNKDGFREKYHRFNEFMNTKMLDLDQDTTGTNIYLSVLTKK